MCLALKKIKQIKLYFPVSFVAKHGHVTQFQPKKYKWKLATDLWKNFVSLMSCFLCHSVSDFC